MRVTLAFWLHTSLLLFLTAVVSLSARSDTDPGVYAPFAAMATALIALSRGFRIPFPGMGRRAPDLFTGLGTLWTAYLWSLDATGSDSRIPDIPGELWVALILFSSISLSTLFSGLMIDLLEWTKHRKK